MFLQPVRPGSRFPIGESAHLGDTAHQRRGRAPVRLTTDYQPPVFPLRLSSAAFIAPLLGAWVWVCAWDCATAQDAPPVAPAQVKPAPAAAEEAKPAEVESPAWLGIVMEVARALDVDEDEKPLPGVGVMDAVEGGPAKKAGLRQFDRVLKLDGKVLKDAEDLRTTVRAHKSGKEVKLRILRDGKEQDVKVTLEQMPPQQNLIMLQGAGNPQLKPDKVQFFNRPFRTAEDSGPDLVILADGNRLEGKVRSATATDLDLTLKGGCEVTLRMSEVTSVRLSGESKARKLPVGVLLRDGGCLAASQISLRDKKFTLTLDDGGKLEIDHAQVAEIAFSNEETPVFGRGANSGDGWKSVPEDAWGRNAGVWMCRSNQGAVLGRKFARLPAALEFSFEASAASESGAMVTLFTYRVEESGGALAPGMVQLGIEGRTVGLNHFDGQRFYNLQSINPGTPVTLPPSEPGKPAHYTVFCDRVKGLLILQVNGLEIGRYEMAKLAPADLERAGGVISFRGQAGFAIANPTVRPWYGYLSKREENALEEDQVIVADQRAMAGEVTKITDTGITLAGGAVVPRSKPVLLKLKPSAGFVTKPAEGTWLEMKDGSAFAAESVLMSNGKTVARTSFAREVSLPMAALRRLSPPRTDPSLSAVRPANTDVLTFVDGRQITGTYVPPMTAGRLRWKIAAARNQLEFPVDELAALGLAPKGASPVTGGQVVRLHNGDWMTGEMTGLDDTSITLKTPFHPALRLDKSGLQSIYPSPGADVVADTASGRNRWLQTASRNSNQITFVEPDDSRSPAYSYADGTYTVRSSAADPTGTRDGLVLALGAADSPVSLEFICSGFDNYLALALLDQKASVAFYLNLSGNSVVVSRATRPIEDANRVQFVRPEQFTFQLPAKTVIGASTRLQIVPDPRARVIHLAVNGRKVGTCRLKKEEPWVDIRYVMFSPTINYGRRFSISDVWVAPWNGRVGDPDARPAGDVSVVFANGDETVAKLVKLAENSVEVDSEATGPLTLPLARIVSMDLNPPTAPEPATHHIRLYDRGLLSASEVKIGEQSVTLTTTLGELTLPLTQVKEITFPKK